MAELTEIMSRVGEENPYASDELLPLVYDELRKLAAAKMSQERLDHTLQATGLVHEAYLRLTDVSVPQSWESRGHFFSAAAEAMRRILVDHARQANRQKRAGSKRRVQMTDFMEPTRQLLPDQLIDLDDALRKLEGQDPPVAELVRLRVFAGLSIRQAAESMQISKTSAYEYWDFAIAWFSLELSPN